MQGFLKQLLAVDQVQSYVRPTDAVHVTFFTLAFWTGSLCLRRLPDD